MKVVLYKPFEGKYPISFTFGEIPLEQEIRERYTMWGLAGHNGVDFALPVGTPVVAAAAGTVSRILTTGDYGNAIMIDHDECQTLYAHLQKNSVVVGQKVEARDTIGLSGDSGFTLGPHLHFGVLPNHAEIENGYLGYVDPMKYMKMERREPNGKKAQTGSQPPVGKKSMQGVKNSQYEALLKGREASSQKRRETIDKVYDYIKTNGPVSSRTIRTELKLSKTSVVRFTNLLRTAGKIRTIGEKTKVQYEAVQAQSSSTEPSLLNSISKWFTSK